jgi:hypothetical protein
MPGYALRNVAMGNCETADDNERLQQDTIAWGAAHKRYKMWRGIRKVLRSHMRKVRSALAIRFIGGRMGKSVLLSVAVCMTSVVAYGQCSYELVGSSGTTKNEFTAQADTTAVTLFTQTGCAWQITDVPSWVAILNGTSGTGSRTVQIAVAANTSTAARSQTITIGGKRFPIFQTGVSLLFTPMQPCRIADTRGFGNFGPGFGTPFMPANTERSFSVLASGCTVPGTAKAYSLNITVVPRKGSLQFLMAWPTGGSFPTGSTLNSFNGRIVANAAIVAAGTGGAISIFVSDEADVIIDINGYFTEPTGSNLAFYPVKPCRVMDTRAEQGFTGPYGPPFLTANTSRAIPMLQSACALPAGAQAFSINVTVLPRKGVLEFLLAWPTGQPLPNASTLNSFDGSVVANAAIVPAGTNSSMSVFVSHDADVLVDVNGYFAPPAGTSALGYHPLSPCRVSDTRGFGGFTGPLGPPAVVPYTTRTIPVRSSACSVPSLALTYVLNATALPRTVLDFLTVQPSGQPFLGVSTLNAFTGQVTANMAIVPAGTAATNGSVDLYTGQFADVILDLNGYFTR